MAISTMDGLVAALPGAQRLILHKASITTSAGWQSSLWDAAGSPGAGSLSIGNTANGIVPTDATAGAPLITAFSGANLGYLTRFTANSSQAVLIRLYDRLFHVGSVSLAAAATTTLASQPSFASRVPATNYGAVEMWVEMAVANNSSATTLSVTYTDQDGNAGATATLDATLASQPIRRMLPLRLAAGDSGVSKVESLIVGGVTGTGSINVVLLRPLAEIMVAVDNITESAHDPFKLGMPQIYADSCLAIMVMGAGTTSGVIMGRADIAQG